MVSGRKTKSFLAVVAVALAVTIGTAASGGASAASGPIVIKAANGHAGHQVGRQQGSDQGEDQGENIARHARRPGPSVPVAVKAVNTNSSASVRGGNGGNVRVVFDNYLPCGSTFTPGTSPIAVTIKAGAGAVGGSSGRNQGSDQAEDQGENIGQHASGDMHIRDLLVRAVNMNVSGNARGGHGGNVSVVFNTIDNCPRRGHPAALVPGRGGSSHQSNGNLNVTLVNQIACASTPSPVVIDGGNGGRGGESGNGQGSDQAEDQGENIGQFASNALGGGPILVRGIDNRNRSSDARGKRGGKVHVTFKNFLVCTDVPSEPVVVMAGAGGAGGDSGRGQGADQAEDQGENIGARASGNVAIGPTSVWSKNLNESGNVSGGPGGDVTLTYHDFTCGTGTSAGSGSLTVSAGDGGAGGDSGRGQGADQAEDQGENIGQRAHGNVQIGPVKVRSFNRNHARNARGGRGGDVDLVYIAEPGCGGSTPPAQPESITAGAGGLGGSSGHEQGADQAEDQGENIGQHATRSTHVGPVSVKATSTNRAGADNGGRAGVVTVTYK